LSPEYASVRLRRTIFAPPAQVYRAWLEPDAVRHWLAPAGFTVTHAEVDERVGGRYWVWGQDETGAIGGFDCELVELVVDRRIVFRWRFLGWDGVVRPQPDSRLTVSLRRASGNATKLSLIHDGLHVLAPAGESYEPPAPLPGRAADLPREQRGEIWRQYKASGDRALRDRLILTYAPLVKYVAGKLGARMPPHVEEGDLISYGLLGLIGAIERFEPERDATFETYAIRRIRGAMIDELRSLDWVPRSVRTRAREIERAMAELENRHKRTPGDEEIAEELGITVGELEESLTQIARSSVVALDELWAGSGSGGESTTLMDTIEDPHAPDPARELLQGEMRQALTQAITRLPDRERLVVTLYYYEELSLREIGDVLGVTESRVSQLHTKALLRLRSLYSRTDALRAPPGPSADDAETPAKATPGPSARSTPAPRAGGAIAMPGMAPGPDRGWRYALDKLAATIAQT
jgi:RNA polymerase sigma factor for flagellar operon FliA